MRYTVNFEQATADFDIGREHQLIVSRGGAAEHVDLAGDGYEGELAYFVDCVSASRAPGLVTAADAVAGLQILEAEQRNRLVGPSRPVGRLDREQDRAVPVGDVEMRIEGGRQIEQRVQQLEPACGPRRSAIGAEVLDRPDPIQVGGERVEAERQPLGGPRRFDVQRTLDVRRLRAARFAHMQDRRRKA